MIWAFFVPGSWIDRDHNEFKTRNLSTFIEIMYLKNQILSINLAQFGFDPVAGQTFNIQLENRQTDAISYDLNLIPIGATSRLFRFDLAQFEIRDGQYTCVIVQGEDPVTLFNVRSTSPDQKTYYDPGVIDTIYEGN